MILNPNVQNRMEHIYGKDYVCLDTLDIHELKYLHLLLQATNNLMYNK
jgi:hypothetical protein